MFVRYFTHVNKDLEAVRRNLEAGPGAWLPDLVQDAFEAGDEVKTRIGVGKHLRLTKDVRVQVGESSGNGDHFSLPVRIEAVGATALFPRMEAQVACARLGQGFTQLAFDATYTPPLGTGGALLDSALLHRVAEAVTKDFMDRVAGKLEEVS